jgi:aspartokinase
VTETIRRLVVKFGGSVLTSGSAVAEAARLTMEASAEERLVVVSAPEGMTDRLVQFVDEVPYPIDPSDEANLVAFGERISARLFTAILRSHGVAARLLEPEDPDWPVATRGGSVGAEIDPGPTRERSVELLGPMLREQVVVICGFLGREGGKVTTLRRGGSDTSALALGAFLQATDVVLVKDVPGILSADPRVIPDARPIAELRAGDLAELVRSGSPIVAPEALEYLNSGPSVRVIALGPPLLDSAGTWVQPGPLDRATPALSKSTDAIGSVTVVVEEGTNGLKVLSERVEGHPWFGLSATPNTVTIFLPESEVLALVRALHATQSFKAVTSRTGLSVRVEDGGARKRPPRAPRGGPGPRVVGAFESGGIVHSVIEREAQLPVERRKGPEKRVR